MYWIESFSSFLWGLPMTALLMSMHIFTTIRLNGVQFHIIRQIKAFFMHKKYDNKGISQNSAFLTILASTMGTGNILGVSSAIISGGPGSLFWMIIAGFLGMATKYAETWLAVKHQKLQKDGTYIGGAMIVLKNYPVLSHLFVLFTCCAGLGIGCSIQSNAASQMIHDTFKIPVIIIAVILSVLTGLVILKGFQGIVSFCNVLIPVAGLLYLISCGLILWMNHDLLFPSIKLILSSAFSPQSFAGGLLGTSVRSAIRYGISRGLFTNEAGMGSTPILSASSFCCNAENPSYIAMMSVFFDTIIVSSITGLIFVSCMIRTPALFLIHQSQSLALACFSLIPFAGKYILTISTTLFAFSTMIGWCAIAERPLQFLYGYTSVIIYRFLWILFIFLGCMTDLRFLWSCSDLFNAFMCLPNILMILQYIDQIQT